MTEPWNFTEAQRRQFREAQIEAKRNPVRDGECPACGSEVRSEFGYVPGRTGMPVSCCDEWHEED
jgi:hypothetical protein